MISTIKLKWNTRINKNKISLPTVAAATKTSPSEHLLIILYHFVYCWFEKYLWYLDSIVINCKQSEKANSFNPHHPSPSLLFISNLSVTKLISWLIHWCTILPMYTYHTTHSLTPAHSHTIRKTCWGWVESRVWGIKGVGGQFCKITVGPRVLTVGMWPQRVGGWFFYPKNSWYPWRWYVPLFGTLTPPDLITMHHFTSFLL